MAAQLRKLAQAGQGLCLVESGRSVAGLKLGPGLQCSCHTTRCLCISQHTGLLNPLDSPHHMRQDEESEFREGIVVDRPTRPGHGSFVNCGMKKVGMGRAGWDIRSGLATATEGRQGLGSPGPRHLCLQFAHDVDLGQRNAPEQGLVAKA